MEQLGASERGVSRYSPKTPERVHDLALGAAGAGAVDERLDRFASVSAAAARRPSALGRGVARRGSPGARGRLRTCSRSASGPITSVSIGSSPSSTNALTPTFTRSPARSARCSRNAGLGDLPLEPAALDAREHALEHRTLPHRVDLGEQLLGALLHLVGERLDEVRAAQRIDHVGDAVSCAIICWVRSATCAACSVGRASASSSALVCSDCVPPSTAASA